MPEVSAAPVSPRSGVISDGTLRAMATGDSQRGMQPQQRPIKIEIDELPLSIGVPVAPDYIGRIVGSAMHEPLLRPAAQGNVIPAAANDWHCTADGHRHEFEIRPER